MTVKLFGEGHVLYDEILVLYGPFYYLYQYLLHSILGMPLDDDWTRMTTVAVWVIVAAVPAGWVWAETRRAWLSAAVYLSTYIYLNSFRNGPGHPQELATLLVLAASTIHLLAGSKHPVVAAAISGMLAAALVLTKINVGVFLLLSLLLGFAISAGDGRMARIFRWATLAAATVLPFVLVRLYLPATWALYFASTISLSIASVVIASGARQQRAGLRPLIAFLLSCLVMGVMLLLFAMAKGTTLRGLVDSLIVAPSRLAKFYIWPLTIGRTTIIFPLFSAALASSFALLSKVGNLQYNWKFAIIFGFVKSGFAICMMSYPFYHNESILPMPIKAVTLGTPFVWLALTRFPAPDHASGSGQFRFFLCLIAAIQPLQIFPVPFDQYFVGTYLQIALAAICLSDTLDWFEGLQGELPFERIARRAALPVALAGCILGLAVIDRRAYLDYHSSFPIEARGASRLRVSERQAAAFRWLIANIDQSFETFLCDTGMNSLYFWTGKSLPGTIVIGNEVDVMTDAQQQSVVDALSRHPDACVIHHPNYSGRPSSSHILLDHLGQDFVTIGRFDTFELRIRKGHTPPVLVECASWEGVYGQSRFVALNLLPMLGRSVARVSLFDIDKGAVVADSSASDPALSLTVRLASAAEGSTDRPLAAGEGLDLSEGRKLSLAFESLPVAGGPMVVRLHDRGGRLLKSLPLLEPL